MMHAIVVDDQDLARLRLRDLLGEIDDVDCVGEARDGHEALELIRTARPDVAFLDIHMPGLSGLDVLRQADPRPLVVFTTAHDQHAVTAFELHALDYLLKPFGPERLRHAVDRARATLAQSVSPDQVERAVGALESTPTLERVFARTAGQIVPVMLRDVEHIEARGDYVRLWQGTRFHLIRASLNHLLPRLNPARFLRVHRSHVVNLDHVTAFAPHDGTRLEATLASGKIVVASRTGSATLRERLAL